jgi:hypothetical protein
MNILFRLLKSFGRLLTSMVIFIVVCIAWVGLLFVFKPWTSAHSGEWLDSRPIAVTSGATNKTKVILFRKLAEETKADSTLVPWPATATGTYEDGKVRSTWKTVGGKAWQFEVVWDERDYLLESRYRLEGDKPVLIESRGRDPSLGFQGVLLAVVSLMVWRITGWWRRRRTPLAKRHWQT